MSCIDVTLICDWCKLVPVGSYHCCEPTGHGRLCPACKDIVDNYGRIPRVDGHEPHCSAIQAWDIPGACNCNRWSDE